MNNRVAVAISGGGRTLENLCLQQDQHKYEIVAIVSSSEQCKGNEFASKFDIPLFVGNFGKKGIETTSKDLEKFLELHQVSWIALGGFLKPFPVFESWKNKIVNIHPALLPQYGGKGMFGMNVHNAVFQNHEKYSGATIHFVTDVYDEGKIIAQSKVNIENLSSASDVAKAVFDIEKKLYPKTLDLLVENDSQELHLPVNIN